MVYKRRHIENLLGTGYSIFHHKYSKGRILSCFNLKGQVFVMTIDHAASYIE